MTNIGVATGIWKGSIATLGLLAGLALAPAPAQAQLCGDPDDIADELLADYFDAFGDFFPLEDKQCESMTKTLFKACNSAVGDAVKCGDRLIDGIPKAAKSVCKAATKNPSDCEDEFKSEAEARKVTVSDDADDAYDECVDAANLFGFACGSDI